MSTKRNGSSVDHRNVAFRDESGRATPRAGPVLRGAARFFTVHFLKRRPNFSNQVRIELLVNVSKGLDSGMMLLASKSVYWFKFYAVKPNLHILAIFVPQGGV